MKTKKTTAQTKYRIAIIGSGVVGKATGMGLVAKGFDVTFVDINKHVVDILKQEGYKAFHSDDLDASTIDVFFVSVPTYVKGYDSGIDHVKTTAAYLGKLFRKQQHFPLIVIRSSVLPGTTEEVLIPIIEKNSGKKAGKDFGICVNPEFLRAVSALEDYKKPWVVVIGEQSKKAGDIVADIYSWVKCPIHRIPIKEAELQKFIHNNYNANKISFFNEMRLLCEQLGLDSDRIFPLVSQSAEGIWNPLYGTFNLGAFGGLCLPKDSRALLHFARKKLGMNLRLIRSVRTVNNLVARKNDKASK